MDSLRACALCGAALGVGAWFESMVRVGPVPCELQRPSESRTFYDEARAVIASLRACVAAPGICSSELLLPTAARFDDPVLMVEAARALAGDAVVNRHRALALLRGLIGGPP